MNLPWPVIDWKQAWTEFEVQASLEVRQSVARLFAEDQIIGEMRHERIISCSLYCKPSDTGVTWPRPTFATVQRLKVRQGRQTWWETYAGPFLKNVHQLAYTRPDTDVHVYLAGDLAWMLKFLRLPQVVIHVMRHDSLTASPGMMWRYLAHDLLGIREIQFVDIEDPWSHAAWMNRIHEWRESGLALLRHVNPTEWDPVVPNLVIYRPLSGGYWVVRPQSDFSMSRACQSFAWLAMQKQIPTQMQHPTRGEVAMFGHCWPDYGIDETFLQHMVYPIFLDRGIATNFNESDSPTLFGLDLAAAAAACPQAVLTRG